MERYNFENVFKLAPSENITLVANGELSTSKEEFLKYMSYCSRQITLTENAMKDAQFNTILLGKVNDYLMDILNELELYETCLNSNATDLAREFEEEIALVKAHLLDAFDTMNSLIDK